MRRPYMRDKQEFLTRAFFLCLFGMDLVNLKNRHIMKQKLISLAVFSLLAFTVMGFSLYRNSDNEESNIVSSETMSENFGYIIVEQDDEGRTLLKISNETGEGICVHANVYIGGNKVPVYGYVPEWANTKKKATFIFWSYNRFSLRDVSDEDYHTDNICPKSKVSQY